MRAMSPQPQRSFVQLLQAAFGHAGRPVDICKALEAELASARVLGLEAPLEPLAEPFLELCDARARARHSAHARHSARARHSACPRRRARRLAGGTAAERCAERLRLLADSEDPGPGFNLLAATLVATVYQGDSSLLQVALPDGTRLQVRSASIGAAAPTEPGRALRLALAVQDTVLLPPDGAAA